MHFFVLSSFFDTAAIQVQITPTQGEISVGDSKFFLCEGNVPYSTWQNSISSINGDGVIKVER